VLSCIQEVEKIQRIGEGQCAEVYKARWRGMHAVAKVLKRAGDYQAGWTLATARADLVHEISVMSHLRHPNLVLFLGACIEHDDIILLNEYMDGGNLEEYVLALKGRHVGQLARVPRKNCARWGVHLAQALTFLHGCDPPVIHRDLKPANLLLCSQGYLKVADFGLSSARHRTMLSSTAYVMTGRTGTIRYMAPEAMMVDDDGNSCYNENVDCYSAAMVMWYICMSDKPFGELDADLIMAGAANGLRPDLASIERRHGQHMADTIRMCWDGNPAKRASADTLLERMRIQVQYVADKKASRRLLPVRKIYKWATSAASKMFSRSSSKGEDSPASKQAPGRQAPPNPVSAMGADVAAEGAVNPPRHRQHKQQDVGSLGQQVDARTGLDNTNTTATTTGTWSLDTTANNWSLDNTAQTQSSVRSHEDWFSQVASENEGGAAARGRHSPGEAAADCSHSKSSTHSSSKESKDGALDLMPEVDQVQISPHLVILAGEQGTQASNRTCEASVPRDTSCDWRQIAFDWGSEKPHGTALAKGQGGDPAVGPAGPAGGDPFTWAQAAFDLPKEACRKEVGIAEGGS